MSEITEPVMQPAENPAPTANAERVHEFKAAIADMRLRDPATSVDRLLIGLGTIGMGGGVGLAVLAYFISHGTRNPLQQRDALILALIGLTVAVVGAALFVKAALARFLRFWMARLVYEQQSYLLAKDSKESSAARGF